MSVCYLDDVNREPLTDPKQDRPTNTGMIHAMGPRCWLPKSCRENPTQRVQMWWELKKSRKLGPVISKRDGENSVIFSAPGILSSSLFVVLLNKALWRKILLYFTSANTSTDRQNSAEICWLMWNVDTLLVWQGQSYDLGNWSVTYQEHFHDFWVCDCRLAYCLMYFYCMCHCS